MSLQDTGALPVCAKSGLSTGNRAVYRSTQLGYFLCVLDVSLRHQLLSSTLDTSRHLQHIGRKLSLSTPLRSLSRSQRGTSGGRKTSLQVPSPAAGVIRELLVPDGGSVEAGNPLFKLKKGAAAANAAPAAEVPAAAAPPPTMAAVPVAVPPRGSTSPIFFCGQAHCSSSTSSSPWGQDREQSKDESYEAEDRPATEGGSADLCHAHHLQRDRHE
uniref:dihydrolipoyllysine-residue succinyltransferase component of 2-oxoglutarate dehydrogenase complex-like n=1 Tax=Oncorhynchus gorbuscha TaxID=8017 RepID=UPI001EAEC84B|nr:dihydrolipoyllysine-residue succinyltransferase component of 2-oxoglutarate dehydrogenase complex-like [Oncorhynchus gorbuscha]XP_046149109.1 dihydrolipoyllysine-residue succinyltransferase component of 2-oxoglutarate dehydrogenase complex-like [Oncorhynchus gorbuscha]